MLDAFNTSQKRKFLWILYVKLWPEVNSGILSMWTLITAR